VVLLRGFSVFTCVCFASQELPVVKASLAANFKTSLLNDKFDADLVAAIRDDLMDERKRLLDRLEDAERALRATLVMENLCCCLSAGEGDAASSAKRARKE
jgi:hypothetical protein